MRKSSAEILSQIGNRIPLPPPQLNFLDITICHVPGKHGLLRLSVKEKAQKKFQEENQGNILENTTFLQKNVDNTIRQGGPGMPQ